MYGISEKACGVDGVSAEHFLYTHNVLHVLLSLLFTSFITNGYLPLDFVKTALVPIIKIKTGDTSDKNNYRPIALVTAASKIFEFCILELLDMYLITHDHQFGFKSKHSTDMAVHIYCEKHYKLYQGSVIGPFLFNVLINDIIKSSDKFNFILYADDTTLNSTLDVFGDTVNQIQLAIMMDLQKISKWLDLNKLCLNITKSKFMLFHMPQRITPQLHLNIKGSPIENVNEFNFLGLTLDCNLNFKPHTRIIAAKISRVIGVLHKLKYIFLAYLLRMIYNSLILPHLNYSLLAWGIQCPNIELLQKKAIRVVNFKSPVAHTEPILKGMNQLKLPDMYTCQLLKLYYKLYRNKLPAYFENFLPEYGDSQHNLRNNCIRLPAIRFEFGKLNAKYQMHFRLRELANPSNPPLYPNINIDNDVTTRSLTGFSKHIKSKFLSGYSLHCDIG